MTATDARPVTQRTPATGARVFSALIGLSALAILLQGLWAGLFLEHDGKRDDAENWITVHARGGEVALVLTVLATAWALYALRTRKDLWIGAGVLTLLLVAESYIGGLIKDEGKDTLTVVHVPLGMSIMGLVVWLAFRGSPRRIS